MTQPTNVPNYVVLPAVFSNGLTQTMQQYTDLPTAQRAAITLTAQTDQQYFVYQAIQYTDKIEDWPQSVVDSVVLPVVNP